MSDVFIEHMVKKLPTAQSEGRKLLIVLGGIVLVLLPFIVSFLGINILMISPVVLVGVIWGGRTLLRRESIEFEYIVTNDDLDVDKIMAKSSRKRLISIDCHRFDILAPIDKLTPEYQNVPRTVDASSSIKNPARWFAVFQAKDGVRTLLIFEPNEKMIETFRRYIPQKMRT